MLRLLFQCLSLWPLQMLWALGALIGRLAWVVSKSYRQKSLKHLSIAGYDVTGFMPDRVRAHTGRLVAELPALWFWPDERLFAHCESPSQTVLTQAIASARREQRGLLVMTPHLGSFEVIPRYIAQHLPMTVLFKPAKSQALDRLLREARNRGVVRSVPADLSGVRALLRCLKRGEAVGMLPDQVPGNGDGILAPFFGQQAWTMTLPQGLIERVKPIVLFAIAERRLAIKPLDRGSWYIHFEIYNGESSPAAINAAMERLIRRFPEQYLWSYNRYKDV
ncbi:MAG: lysophospholipid acyltransferase family protein [Betaproteobacteria bacterium]|nr:lysophospholipid acyltransferase family protein [Betaproteobacteria bacterium]